MSYCEPARVANISPLAGIPFQLLSCSECLSYEEHSPTENARRLREGLVDAALIPAYDFFQQGCYQSLDFGLGCRSRSDSMVLYARRPAQELRLIRYYHSSCSSLALLRLLLKKRWGIEPKFKRQPENEPFGELCENEGALILHQLPGLLRRDCVVHEDLATAWHVETGLPFVFLIWAARPGALRSAHIDALQCWFHRGVRAGGALARRYAWERGLSQSLAAEFVADHRRFYLDDFLLGGLEEFLIRLQSQNLLGKVAYRTLKMNLFGEVLKSPRPRLCFN